MARNEEIMGWNIGNAGRYFDLLSGEPQTNNLKILCHIACDVIFILVVFNYFS
jgi:hypothetical protein